MEGTPASRDERRDLQVPVHFLSDGESRIALSENISVGGLFVATSSPGRIGDRLVVKFRLPSAQKMIVIDGEVRWIRTNPATGVRHGARGMGVQFTRVSFDAASLIREFLGG